MSRLILRFVKRQGCRAIRYVCLNGVRLSSMKMPQLVDTGISTRFFSKCLLQTQLLWTGRPSRCAGLCPQKFKLLRRYPNWTRHTSRRSMERRSCKSTTTPPRGRPQGYAPTIHEKPLARPVYRRDVANPVLFQWLIRR